MLMDAHRGAVKHLHFAVVGLADRGHDAVPNPGFAPPHKAVVAGCRRAVFLGQRPPRRACSQDPKNPIQNPPVIHPRNAARLIRQQRRNYTLFKIRQLIPLHDQTLPNGKLESHLDSRGNPLFYEFMT